MRKSAAAVALVAAGAFALTACSSGGSTGGSSNEDTIVTANGTEPQNKLVPASTNEVGGGRIVDMLFAGLVYYKADGTPQNEIAKSIDTQDSKTYTITLNDGWKFTNGEAITPQTFVDTWNWAANAKNAQLNASFFEPIQGYDEVSATKDTGKKDEDGAPVLEAAPTAETMSGLKVTGDDTFTVTLKQEESDFPLRLGYSAYYPMPSVAFDDIDSYGENPIGDGPYKLAKEGAWQHGKKIDLVPNTDYNGGRKAENDGLRFVFYENYDSAYADLQANNLDVIDAIPDGSLGSFKDELGDRAVNENPAVFQSFTIPERLPHFGKDEEGQLRRQAISMAIDRKQICDTLYFGTRTPAHDFTAPFLSAYSDSITGSDVLEYNAEKAKDLWAQANAISPWTGTFEIAYNSDGPHQAWVEAVVNSIKNTLAIDAAPKPYPTFGEFRQAVTDRSIQTPFRTGWQADYPSSYNFLFSLYSSAAADGQGSNDGDYKNPAFDQLLVQAAAATDQDSADKLYQQSQEILFKDLPAIPLWYQNSFGGYSENVQNVHFGWNTVPLYYQVTKG